MDDLMTLSAVGDLLNMPECRVLRLADRGALRVVAVDGHLLVPRADALRFQEALSVKVIERMNEREERRWRYRNAEAAQDAKLRLIGLVIAICLFALACYMVSTYGWPVYGADPTLQPTPPPGQVL